MSDRAQVRNAADPQQVKRAGRRAKRQEEARRARLHAVMQHEYGRAALWDLLDRAGVFNSVFHPSGSQMYYLSGRQDFGREVLGELIDIDEELYLTMEREARIRARREALETDAAHTPRAGEQGTDDERTGEVDG